MHDLVLGFVCFMAGAFFVVAVGFVLLGRMPLERRFEKQPNLASPVTDPPLVEPERRRRREPDPHPIWPVCDCPSEAFHTKYYPSAGVTRIGF